MNIPLDSKHNSTTNMSKYILAQFTRKNMLS